MRKLHYPVTQTNKEISETKSPILSTIKKVVRKARDKKNK